jgi:hypothetical protein
MSCAFVTVFGNRTLLPNKLLVLSRVLERQSSNSTQLSGMTEN